jgi:hypothetical protein
MGIAPFSNPVSPEEIRCSAIGNSVKGTATQSTDSASIRSRSFRSNRIRAAGTSHTTIAPKTIRSQVTTPGWSVSRLTAISRNDDPRWTRRDPNPAG